MEAFTFEDLGSVREHRSARTPEADMCLKSPSLDYAPVPISAADSFTCNLDLRVRNLEGLGIESSMRILATQREIERVTSDNAALRQEYSAVQTAFQAQQRLMEALSQKCDDLTNLVKADRFRPDPSFLPEDDMDEEEDQTRNTFLRKPSRAHHHRRTNLGLPADNTQRALVLRRRQYSDISDPTPYPSDETFDNATKRRMLARAWDGNPGTMATKTVESLLRDEQEMLWQLLFTYGLDTEQGFVAWVPVDNSKHIAISLSFIRSIHRRVFGHKVPPGEQLLRRLLNRENEERSEEVSTQVRDDAFSILPLRSRRAKKDTAYEEALSEEEVSRILLVPPKVSDMRRSFCIVECGFFVEMMSRVAVNELSMQRLDMSEYDVGRASTGNLSFSSMLNNAHVVNAFLRRPELANKNLINSKSFPERFSASQDVLVRILPVVHEILANRGEHSIQWTRQLHHVGKKLACGPLCDPQERYKLLMHLRTQGSLPVVPPPQQPPRIENYELESAIYHQLFANTVDYSAINMSFNSAPPPLSTIADLVEEVIAEGSVGNKGDTTHQISMGTTTTVTQSLIYTGIRTGERWHPVLFPGGSR